MQKKSNTLPWLITLLAVSLSVWTYIRAEGTTITACAQKGSGQLFLVGPEFKTRNCERNGKIISWNSEGVSGLQGPQGNPGPALHLFDANDQDLGIVIDGSIHYATYTTFLTIQKLIVNFANSESMATLLPATVEDLAFEGGDCTGSFYLRQDTSFDQQTLIRPSVTGKSFGYFKPRDFETREVTIHSFSHGGPCLPVNEATTTYGSLEEVILPFSLPLAWPLEIREQ